MVLLQVRQDMSFGCCDRFGDDSACGLMPKVCTKTTLPASSGCWSCTQHAQYVFCRFNSQQAIISIIISFFSVIMLNITDCRHCSLLCFCEVPQISHKFAPLPELLGNQSFRHKFRYCYLLSGYQPNALHGFRFPQRQEPFSLRSEPADFQVQAASPSDHEHFRCQLLLARACRIHGTCRIVSIWQ